MSAAGPCARLNITGAGAAVDCRTARKWGLVSRLGRRSVQEIRVLESRPPPHVLMIYAADGVDYAAFFAASGFTLTEAQSAAEGLERATALRPDLIVLDFGFDGDLVARLRGNDATHAIPIIALTEVCRLGKPVS
jgi:hypothetical protein